MIHLSLLREKPEWVRQSIQKKKFSCDFDSLLELDKERRLLIQKTEEIRSRQKIDNQEMVQLKKGSPVFIEKVKQMKKISEQIKKTQSQLQTVEEAWDKILLTVPNLPHESVPQGKGESDNKIVRTWSNIEQEKASVAHYDIPGFSKGIDFQRGTKVTSSGFPFFVGEMARLMRGLIQFCLDEATHAGYVEIMPPFLVNSASATATGQLPDKEGQMYPIEGEDYYLVPTAEVPVTNFYRDEIFPVDRLPLYHVAYTACFRREAGSYGQKARGLNRLHQFDKVELVKWVHPDKSFEELEQLVKNVENLLQKLELPYRVLQICSGDLGFPHAKQYDLEVWSPGQETWLEVSSCSNFTDFQARRANIRFRENNKKTEPVHTLNGSGLGLPRTLIALLENNFRKEQNCINIPKALQPFVGKSSIKIA